MKQAKVTEHLVQRLLPLHEKCLVRLRATSDTYNSNSLIKLHPLTALVHGYVLDREKGEAWWEERSSRYPSSYWSDGITCMILDP